MKRTLAITLALVSLVLAPLPSAAAHSGDAPVGLKIVDVALVRPLTMVGSVATTAFYLGTLPLTFATGVADSSARVFVLAPWRFTSARHMGDFENYRDGGDVFGSGARD